MLRIENGTSDQQTDRVLYICFDGTTNNFWDESHDSVMTSLYKQSKSNFDADSVFIYCRGPGSEHSLFRALLGIIKESNSEHSINNTLEESQKYCLGNMNGYTKVIINGYSRGCFTAVAFSNWLYENMRDLPVYMQLLDPTTSAAEAKTQYVVGASRYQKCCVLRENVKNVVIHQRARESEYDLASGYGYRFLHRVEIDASRAQNYHSVVVDSGHLELNGLLPASIANAWQEGYWSAAVKAVNYDAVENARLQQSRTLINALNSSFCHNHEDHVDREVVSSIGHFNSQQQIVEPLIAYNVDGAPGDCLSRVCDYISGFFGAPQRRASWLNDPIIDEQPRFPVPAA